MTAVLPYTPNELLPSAAGAHVVGIAGHCPDNARTLLLEAVRHYLTVVRPSSPHATAERDFDDLMPEINEIMREVDAEFPEECE